MNILFLTNELNYTDGVSTHLYFLLKNLNEVRNLNVKLMCSGGEAIGKFTDAGIEVIVDTNLNHKNRNLKNFTSAVHSVYKLARTENIQIVHSHNHYAANIAHWVSKFLTIRTVQTNHGIIKNVGKLNHYTSKYYIVLNETILKYFYKNRISDKNNTSLIFNGIDFPEFPVIKKNKYIRVIAASRLIKEKGLVTFIKAVSILDEEIKTRAEFIIAGEGLDENEFKILNDKLRAGVKFIGQQTDMNEILKDTDIFIIPTESGNEAFPMTILEAAAANNLIISSDFNGSQDFLTKDTDSLIFRMKDEIDLAAKIKYAILNPEISVKLSESFFFKAKRLYNSMIMSKRHSELYKSILTESINKSLYDT
jgi:glycosyltransferase involved in cell wall biosynthesis